MHTALLSLVIALSVQDQLDGSEIGDATQFMTFESSGKFAAERDDKKGGKTAAHGTWAVEGNTVTVKIASCKGPACKELGQGFSADIDLVAERAMTVRANPSSAALSTGSYYCHYQGCEKRTGVEIVTHSSRPVVMKYLVDFLVDKNRTRDVTVVWWGKRAPEKVERSSLEYCNREPERAKKGVELVMKDLAELPWLGTLTAKPSPEPACLYDVRLFVADDVTLPQKR